jgi:SRSO17 transposase
MAEKELNDKDIELINDTVHDILWFIDKAYKTIKVEESLWEYEDDLKKEFMPHPTKLCEEIGSHLIIKLNELKRGEE